MIQTAGIVAVGDEVLNGETINTNAAWIAQQLTSLGVRTLFHLVVGDHRSTLADTVRGCLDRAELTLVVGGLGPTHDDVTKEAVADALQTALEPNPDVTRWIEERHGISAGRTASVQRQSTTLKGSMVFRNSRGTAPGQLISHDHRWVALLPGPPREMQAVFSEHLRPWIKQEAHVAIRRDTWVTYQWGESVVAHFLDDLVHGQHPRVGLYASPGVVEIRLESLVDMADGSSLANLRAAAWIQRWLPGQVYYRPTSGPTRAQILVDACRRQGYSLAIMESLTGGMLTSRLVDVPGASQCLKEGAIAYTDEAKHRWGVASATLARHGAVSSVCAREMARAIRLGTDASIGMATTGFAGPDGGTADAPVGTFFVAVDMETRTWVRRRTLRSDRAGVRTAATEAALTVLWEVLGIPPTP